MKHTDPEQWEINPKGARLGLQRRWNSRYHELLLEGTHNGPVCIVCGI